ncbi:MAG: hypothetical protein K2I80_01725 [Ruminococcus sp.]|nr:hypothetical protein [Ruminococcus sp.]MDE6849447.1 hypothetical protein [Ruminococcus sp.]
MKKIIAVLAFTAVLCSFASCGNDVADEISEEFSVTSVSEEVTEEETTEEVTESETDEVTEEETDGKESENITESAEKLSAEGSYEEAIEMLVECINNKDAEGMISLVFPDRYYNVIEIIAEMNGVSLDEVADDMYDTSNESLRLAEIISDEPITDDYMVLINEMYGGFQAISDYIEKNGSENIDYDEFAEAIDMSDLKPYFEISDGHLVNCIFESENKNGEKDTYEQELIMYYIDGEGWKTDLFMMGYIKKAKQASINSGAATMYKASAASLTELDEPDVELPETCIISSDHNRSYNVNDDFVSQFEERLENFFSDYKEYNYFIVIQNGTAVYTAITKSENLQYIGTYPANKIYSADNEYVTKDEKITYDEIYNICLEQLK